METTLHRELKLLAAGSLRDTEVRVGRFRIDALAGGRLVEIQHASLASIRDKVRELLATHDVTLVKPLIRRKHLVKYADTSERVHSRRWSPRKGTWFDLFHELVHFTRVFPHPRLHLELLLIDIEEHREPFRGGRRRRFTPTHQVRDQRLLEIVEQRRLSQASDLLELLPPLPAAPFGTATLAREWGLKSWVARRIAYCLRETALLELLGKKGNALLYRPHATSCVDRAAAIPHLLPEQRDRQRRGQRLVRQSFKRLDRSAIPVE